MTTTTTTTTTMMELIDGDIAKHIWGFFLIFDEAEMTAPSSLAATATATRTATAEYAMNNNRDNNNNHRCVDIQSIRSLRFVNKFFYNAFGEFSGWSRCAGAIKSEYIFLKNEKFTEIGAVLFRAQNRWANPQPSARAITNHHDHRRRQKGRRPGGGGATANTSATTTNNNNTNNNNNNNSSNKLTHEQRKEIGQLVSAAMKNKKALVQRRNHLIRLLDRGPFTKDEKHLTYDQIVIQ